MSESSAAPESHRKRKIEQLRLDRTRSFVRGCHDPAEYLVIARVDQLQDLDQRRSSALLNGPIRFPQHLFRCPQSRTARAGSRSSYLPLRRPDCTLSRLRADEYDRPVTQSIATPEPSSRTIPTLDQVLVSCKSLECVTTPES